MRKSKPSKKELDEIAKKAEEESVPFELFFNDDSEKPEEPKTIKVEDFVPPSGTPKRSAWSKWKRDIDTLRKEGNIVIIKKEDGTQEIIQPEDDTDQIKEDQNKQKQKTLTRLQKKVAKKEKKKKALEKKLSQLKIIDDPEEDFDYFIEIAVSCTWYQKRLDWMMSSVLNQKGDVPKILFNVAYTKDNGDPTTEKVCSFFRKKGLNIRETVYDDFSTIQFRGFARNRQLIGSQAKWMLFADCDMYYSPYFFEDLAQQLRGQFRKESRCLSARRVSLDKTHCKDLFNNDPSKKYPRVIDAEDIEKWPKYRISRSCGAGYFQLFNVRTMRENTRGLYVSPDKNPDMPEHDRYHKTYSDKTFRKSINGIVNIKTKPQYHLNHERDNETRKHITIQR